MSDATNRVPGIAVGGLVFFLLIAGAFAWIMMSRTAATLPPPQFETLAPPEALNPDWALHALDGKETTIAAFKGKPLLINIWATWCPPCLAEMPSIDALHRSLQGKGVQFLIVATEDAKTVADKVAEEGWTLPVYTTKEDLPPVLTTRGIPATFIVDTKGNVIAKHVGAADWNSRIARDFLGKLVRNHSGELE